MIETLSLEIEHPEQLAFFLASSPVQSKYQGAQSCLLLMFSANSDEFFLNQLVNAANFWCPKACIAGATSTGEIRHGETLLGKTIITLYFFRESQVSLIAIDEVAGREQQIGAVIAESLSKIDALQGVMLLANPMTCSFDQCLSSIHSVTGTLPLFGGGAGDYAMSQAWVMGGKICSQTALVAIAFSGPSLHLELHHVLGWRRMTPPMKVTSVAGTQVHTIDGRPASEVYREFLGIAPDGQFFSNALGFPMLTRENEQLVAKVPLQASEDGSLSFFNQFQEGEEFALGFVHPELLEQQLQTLNRKMAAFFPDTLLLFSCGCRRFVLLDDILDETRSFEQIAPTFGFYTVTEIAGNNGLLSLSLVALGLREGDKPMREPALPRFSEQLVDGRIDQFASTHSRILKRLLHFISALNRELEVKSRKMEALSYLDGLTGIANRRRFEIRIEDDWSRAQRSGQPLTLLMIDVDSFKAYNDTYGHLAGDDCLRQLAQVMTSAVTRSSDLVARYGGEEFAVIMPDTGEKGGRRVAHEIKRRVSQLAIPHSGNLADSDSVTVSIGVASVVPTFGMSADSLQAAADEALYRAKGNGRNRVEVSAQIHGVSRRIGLSSN